MELRRAAVNAAFLFFATLGFTFPAAARASVITHVLAYDIPHAPPKSFQLVFNNVPLAISDGLLTFRARGDYDGEEWYSDEVIFWDIDNLFGESWFDWVDAGNIAGVSQGATILEDFGRFGDVLWTQQVVVPQSIMHAATLDRILALNLAAHMTDSYYDTDFFSVSLSYKAIPEPSMLLLLALGLPGLLLARKARSMRRRTKRTLSPAQA